MSSTSVEPGGLSQLSRRSFNDFAAAAMASTLGSSPGSSPGGQASGKVSKVGVDVGGRGDTEDVAEVDEVGLGGRFLGEGDPGPFPLELDRVHMRSWLYIGKHSSVHHSNVDLYP